MRTSVKKTGRQVQNTKYGRGRRLTRYLSGNNDGLLTAPKRLSSVRLRYSQTKAHLYLCFQSKTMCAVKMFGFSARLQTPQAWVGRSVKGNRRSQDKQSPSLLGSIMSFTIVIDWPTRHRRLVSPRTTSCVRLYTSGKSLRFWRDACSDSADKRGNLGTSLLGAAFLPRPVQIAASTAVDGRHINERQGKGMVQGDLSTRLQRLISRTLTVLARDEILTACTTHGNIFRRPEP